MPLYEVVRLGGPVPVHAPEFGTLSEPKLPDGLDPKGYAVRPARDLNWRERERRRFEDGTYKRPPWPDNILRALEEHCRFHYLHVSLRDPTKVSYTESPEKGEIDRQSAPMSAGRYLQRYARYREYNAEVPSEYARPWLSPEQIRELNAMLMPAGAVKFGKTADDFERVYKFGPRSCMAGDASEFSSPIHPVRIYAAGDLEIAYLEPEPDNITARVLIWPEKKVYGRPYGDQHRLLHQLHQDGYKYGSLVGARLLKVMDGVAYVAPYIDRHFYMEDMGDYCCISDSGSIHCGSTDGLAHAGVCCFYCGNRYDEEDMTSTDNGLWCSDCVDQHLFWCAGYGEYCGRHELWGEVRGIGEVCASYFEDHCFVCERTEIAYRNDDMDSITMANGETWSMRAYERYGGHCDRTCEYYPEDELVTLADTGETVSEEWAKEHAVCIDGDYYDTAPEAELPEAA